MDKRIVTIKLQGRGKNVMKNVTKSMNKIKKVVKLHFTYDFPTT